MNLLNKYFAVLVSTILLSACSGGGGGGSGGVVADTDPSGDVLTNEAVLSKEPTNISTYDNSFYSTFKAKFSTNYTDSIAAAYPQQLVEDYIYDEIILKSATCDSNTFPGTALSFNAEGFLTSSIDASYSNCTVGSSLQTGSLKSDTGTYTKHSVTSTYLDSNNPNFAQETSKSYHIWETKKTTSGTTDTYTYRSREGYLKHQTHPLQYMAHWMTFNIDKSTTPATVTGSGKVQMYLKDATDGDVMKSYMINFTNLKHYTSGSNNCVTGTGKLSDGTNTQSGVYIGSANPMLFGGGIEGLIICFSKVNF